jgi:hypothetical protein
LQESVLGTLVDLAHNECVFGLLEQVKLHGANMA